MDDDATLFAELKTLGDGTYAYLCRKGDRVCGIGRFAYTWGLMVGMTRETPYERRYCYEHAGDALIALVDWDGTDDAHPAGPWIKCKGKYRGEWIDELGPGASA